MRFFEIVEMDVKPESLVMGHSSIGMRISVRLPVGLFKIVA
jgi:hypothetical protein